jgi:hypothetical protein
LTCDQVRTHLWHADTKAQRIAAGVDGTIHALLLLLPLLPPPLLRVVHATEFPALEDVEAFVVYESARCGIEAVCSRRWRYGLGCLLFELTRTA